MMTENTPILSICVPTYNRAARLRQCLLSITGALEAFGDQVELLVSDNASTDETSLVVQEFQERFSRLRYHRNAENVGAERNFRLCGEMARGDYVWLIGDDDSIVPDAVGTVLDRLSEDVSVVICNFSMWSNDRAFLKQSHHYPFLEDMDIKHHDEVLQRFGVGLAYISSVVIKRSLYIAVDRSAYLSFAEYGFSFLYSVYAALLKECHVVYLARPLVCNRMVHSVAYDWFRVFVTGTAMVLTRLVREGYSAEIAAQAKDKVLAQYIVGNIFYHGMRYQNSIAGTIRLLWPHYNKNWRLWLICVPALLVPRSIVELARKMVRGTRGLCYRALRLIGKSGQMPARGRFL